MIQRSAFRRACAWYAQVSKKGQVTVTLLPSGCLTRRSATGCLRRKTDCLSVADRSRSRHIGFAGIVRIVSGPAPPYRDLQLGALHERQFREARRLFVG